MNRPVLLVEDSEDDVFLMRHAWQKAGVKRQLEVASDGQAAIEWLGSVATSPEAGSKLPCLVLLDLKMPRMPGLEVLDWIRRHHQLRLLPVLVLTSSSVPTDIEAAYQRGANAYFSKPANASELLEWVKLVNSLWLERCYLPELKSVQS